MNLLLITMLSVAAVVGLAEGFIILVKSIFRKMFSLAISSAATNFQIAAPFKPKELSKPPLTNPELQGNNNINNNINNNVSYNSNPIPNMRGVDSGNDIASMPAGMPSMPAGGGASANVAVGVLTGVLVGPQSGTIGNVYAGRKIVAPKNVLQSGRVFNRRS